MSLLPERILPQTMPLGRADENGVVTIEKDWWLLLYNLCIQTLSGNTGLPSDDLIDLMSADGDALDADAMALRQPIRNLQLQIPPDFVVSPNDLPDIARALLIAQDPFLSEPVPQAQAAQTLTVGASPFTFTAPFNGTVSVTGGTVSAIQLIRQTTTVATGLTAGMIPVSRGDQVKVTYSVAPTMVFLST